MVLGARFRDISRKPPANELRHNTLTPERSIQLLMDIHHPSDDKLFVKYNHLSHDINTRASAQEEMPTIFQLSTVNEASVYIFCCKLLRLFEEYEDKSCEKCDLAPKLAIGCPISMREGDISLSIHLPIHNRGRGLCTEIDIALCYPFSREGEYSIGNLCSTEQYKALEKIDDVFISFLSKPLDRTSATLLVSHLSRSNAVFNDEGGKEIYVI